MLNIFLKKANWQSIRNKLFLFFLFNIQVILVRGQLSQNNFYLNNEIKFERLAIENGFSNNIAFGMVQDKKGFMWFATLDGLIKYDGYTLTRYQNNPKDSNSLGDNIVMSVFEDHTGLIWVGTAGGGGVNSFDPQTGKWKRYPHNPKNSNSMGKGAIEGIEEDHNGMLWFGSTDGLTRYDPDKSRFTVFVNNPADKYSLSNNRVYSVKEDKAGRLWIGTDTGLNLFDPQQGRFYQVGGDFKDSLLLKRAVVHHIFEDQQGLLWLSTWNGVFVIDPDSKKCSAYYHHNALDPKSIGSDVVFAITQDNTGSYWVSTESGLHYFDPKTKIFALYEHKSFLPTTKTKGHIIMTDRAGLIWIGTNGRGIIYFSSKQRKFRRYLNDEASLFFGTGTNRIKAIFKSGNNQLFVATSQNLLKFNTTKDNFEEVLQLKSLHLIQDNTFTTACEEKPGIIWLGSYRSGIIRYDIHTGKTTFLQNDPSDSESLASNEVEVLYRDRSGTVWVGTQGGHLQWYDSVRGKFNHYPYLSKDEEVPPSTGIRFIHEDRQGNLWLGTHAFHMALGGNGLYQINRQSGKIKRYKHQPGVTGSLSNNGVTCFYEDQKGIFWIGTHGGGLNRLDATSGKITVYNKEQGLISNTVQRLAGDKAGNLWVVADEGITRFNTTTLKTKQFGLADGLPGSPLGVEVDDYNTYISMESPDGTIYFGSGNGLIVFNPASIEENNFKPPVVITQFKVFDKSYPVVGSEIALAYNQNFFEIEFAALSHLSSERNQYAYMLEGVDDDWVNNGNRRLARYTNVSPGTYIFRVKGSNNDGVWNDQGTALAITIHPPWWRTWWAYTIYGLLTVGSIWAFIHYRSLNLLRQKRMLQKQVAERTAEVVHQKEELQTSLDNLKFTQAQLVQSEKMASLGELTAGIAHEIQNPLNFVNNFSEVSKELISEMVDEVNKGNTDEVKSLAGIVQQNLDKILHHGKRADAIVKGMLQHSRRSSAVKEPTDINKLADEYLRLAYHGLRAKEKDFNADFTTDFDETIGKVNIVPQDIGRGLLNLLNNAFYAVNEKRKKAGNEYNRKCQ